MAEEWELNPVDFLTVGTVGPRGKRVFYIQGAKDDELVSLIVEKMQVNALAEAIDDLFVEIGQQHSDLTEETIDLEAFNFELRDPIQPEFRVAQIGLGYDEASDMVIIVTQELLTDEQLETAEPRVVRFWGDRRLLTALAIYAGTVVERGRPDPQKNGRIHYYWT
ncbi:DUF3090 family protein [Chloroflexota bacterium]